MNISAALDGLRTLLVGISPLSFIIGNIVMTLIPGAFIPGLCIVLLSATLPLATAGVTTLSRYMLTNERGTR